jgi:hypothetical protein
MKHFADIISALELADGILLHLTDTLDNSFIRKDLFPE